MFNKKVQLQMKKSPTANAGLKAWHNNNIEAVARDFIVTPLNNCLKAMQEAGLDEANIDNELKQKANLLVSLAFRNSSAADVQELTQVAYELLKLNTNISFKEGTNDAFKAFEPINQMLARQEKITGERITENKLTFVHLVDPIGSVIEAYKALKPGGILVIDRLPVPGCRGSGAALIEYLQKEGYEVLSSNCEEAIEPFIIKKTKPDLLFPLQVKITSKGNVKYTIHPEVQLTSSKNDKTAYESGQKCIVRIANRIDTVIKDDCMTPLFYPGNYVGGIVINSLENAIDKECEHREEDETIKHSRIRFSKSSRLKI